MSSHEPIQSHRKVILSSNRKFGIIFSLIFLFISIWPWLQLGKPVIVWLLIVAIIFALLALFAESSLGPLNRFWFRLGLMMHTFISPIIMAILFYCAVTPMAIILRIGRKDLLRLHKTQTDTYWIKREPAGPLPGSMKNQF